MVRARPVIDLDPRSPIPLYRQIVEGIRRKIAIGALRPGDKLATVRDLAVQARVNRNTAARAIQILESGGWVTTRVGKGTFVETPPDGIDRALAERQVATLLDRAILEAHSLGLPLQDLASSLSRRIDAFREAQDETNESNKEGRE